ncbi:hypothetical protein ACMD2_22476 [Ananas comosus]|uniref:Uncharacterized protein n=1 Tax=Ananas comosus TaxID=4615 RepID=A0A199VG54_ANACO|nr:hypothetical protein ACMD2_22476 [Ananas comosus]
MLNWKVCILAGNLTNSFVFKGEARSSIPIPSTFRWLWPISRWSVVEGSSYMYLTRTVEMFNSGSSMQCEGTTQSLTRTENRCNGN